jgi:hypothetical protein
MSANELQVGIQRHEKLLRETGNKRLARWLRKGRPQRFTRTGSGRRIATLRRVTALWGRISIPFFRS